MGLSWVLSGVDLNSHGRPIGSQWRCAVWREGQICIRLHGGASRSSGCKNLHFGTRMPFLRGLTVDRFQPHFSSSAVGGRTMPSSVLNPPCIKRSDGMKVKPGWEHSEPPRVLCRPVGLSGYLVSVSDSMLRCGKFILNIGSCGVLSQAISFSRM
jgi:hypothetical protein